VWACTKHISGSVATLPLGFYKRTPDGRQSAPDHPLYEILHNSPNWRMTAVNYWGAKVANLLLWGNAYSEIVRNTSRSRVISLEPMLSEFTARVYDRAEGRWYYENTVNGEKRRIPALGADGLPNVMHVRAFSMNGEEGMSAVQYGRATIGSSLAASKAADETFRDASRASGLVTVDHIMQAGQRDQVRTHIDQVSKAGGVYVLEKGMGYQNLRFNPHDAELLASRSFSVEEICRWFSVPPIMIGHGDKQSSWPTATDAQGQLYLNYVLLHILRGIEQEIRRSLLTTRERAEYFAEFSVEGLLRGDSAARASYYSQMVNNGIMTRDEVRSLENLAPMRGNAEVLTVQSALLPIDKLGADAAPPATPDPTA
jgi:HK97 family phage portal protein